MYARGSGVCPGALSVSPRVAREDPVDWLLDRSSAGTHFLKKLIERQSSYSMSYSRVNLGNRMQSAWSDLHAGIWSRGSVQERQMEVMVAEEKPTGRKGSRAWP